ncbi:MAG: hypothetical protein HZA50_10205 [Planctomycetes bacterium]|nr:hypothetical protein [Planctomycetota bacterium]
MNDAACQSELLAAVRQCRSDEQAMAELRKLLDEAEAQIARIGGECSACGKCCRFALVDHRLYATTAELALLTSLDPPAQIVPPGRCHYQQADQCLARDRRPLGCRTFFCPPKGGRERSAIHEQFHRQIRRLHDRHGLSYLYTEITNSLSVLL